MLLNELTKMYEKSTQYYYFSDDMLKAMDSNDEIKNWLREWIFTDGPGSDARYSPELFFDDYMELMTPEEISMMQTEYQTKFRKSLGEEEKKESEASKTKKPSVVVKGTLLVIGNYGSETEPQKAMWNGARGEVLGKNPDGTFKVRITDVKDSNVLFSKKWYDDEEKAMLQRLNLKRDEFKTLADIEAEEAEG